MVDEECEELPTQTGDDLHACHRTDLLTVAAGRAPAGAQLQHAAPGRRCARRTFHGSRVEPASGEHACHCQFQDRFETSGHETTAGKWWPAVEAGASCRGSGTGAVIVLRHDH